MSDIQTILFQILSARYGEDVRQSIHDGIQMCYNDMEDYNQFPEYYEGNLNASLEISDTIMVNLRLVKDYIDPEEILSDTILKSNGDPSSLSNIQHDSYFVKKYNVENLRGKTIFIEASSVFTNCVYSILDSETSVINKLNRKADNPRVLRLLNYPLYIPDNASILYVSQSMSVNSGIYNIRGMNSEPNFTDFSDLSKNKTKKEIIFDISNKKTLISDGRITGSVNGALTDIYMVSDYFSVVGLGKIFIEYASADYTNAIGLFLDKDFNIVSSLGTGNGSYTPVEIENQDVIVPDAAVYMILSGVTKPPKAFKYVPIENSKSTTNNAYAPSTVHTDRVISASNGTLVETSGVTAYTVNEYDLTDVSGKVYITGGASFRNAIYAFYNESDIVLEKEIDSIGGKDGTVIYNKLIQIPKNAKKLRVSNNVYKEPLIFVSKEPIEYHGKWENKKWIVFGDSLTEFNSRTLKHYFYYIREETGIQISNYGLSGTGYMRRYDEGNAFYQRIEDIDEDFDVITIFGSGNDLSLISSLGEPDDTETNTICGCINATIDNLFKKYPLANLGIVTPTPWDTSRSNNSMEQYSNAIVEICKNRGIPCLDLYHCSGLRPWEATFRELAYSKDDGSGTHPDETGHAIIAPRFEAFLDSLLLH